ncbi:MAG: nucleotidyl transferase AbiEii/AbiGii toxin family protein [Planctomycetaceae bacterium]|nr:nucleotidyl transferase AbiEii/AbiGii toxin family protein [Planctomycetaceae bacterium]
MSEPLMIDLDITSKKVIAALRKTDKPFAFTGGLAAITYGDPRMTNDVDLIMEINPRERDFADKLADTLSDEFFFSVEACREAIDEQSMFQAIDKETMFKVDIHLSDIVPGALERRRDETIVTGRTVPMVSPEDAILSKLHWIKLGSGRSRKDVVAMLRVQENLDNDYLEATAEQLGVKSILDELRKIAESYDPNMIL